MSRKFHVLFLEHEEGVSVSCPELPGCHSQGGTVAEALENIGWAISEYLESFGAPEPRYQVRELEVAVSDRAEVARR